ncbi:MAG: VTT domain-containing protein [Deltaproteobacteria bacterium]|nr:VTT domain-containing protein [Deltaproteobacteria bacterium]
MNSFYQFLTELHSSGGLEQLIRTGGPWLIMFIIFSETGLLAGFFLPGDSLLVTAGYLTTKSFGYHQPILDFYLLNLGLIGAAFIGDQLGYFLGNKTGHRIFAKADGRFFKKKYAEDAHAFYERHGGKAVVMARFVPIFRTFVPFIAGVAEMPYKKFILFSILGASLWIISLTSVGHFLGKSALGEKIHSIILSVVFISILPMLLTLIKKALLARRAKIKTTLG